MSALHEAREALDRLIAEPRPCTMDKAREVFILLTARRDALADAGAHGEELARVNAALSMVWSAVLPQSGFRPGRLEKARALLDGA